MTKRATSALRNSGYDAGTHPVIAALVEFAAQNSGLDFANYGDRKAYRQEARDIGRDWQSVKRSLNIAHAEGVTDADVIEAAPRAFSGRLQWGRKQHTPASVEAGEATSEGAWSYCTGQYWPTEYRKAAAAVLSQAFHVVRQSRTVQRRVIHSIADLREWHDQQGSHWFSRGAMRFFGTRIESGLVGGNFFVTSEQPPHGRRGYTLRMFDLNTGNIDTIGELAGHSSKADALASRFEQRQAA